MKQCFLGTATRCQHWSLWVRFLAVAYKAQWMDVGGGGMSPGGGVVVEDGTSA